MNDVSYSMYVEKKKDIKSVLPRKIHSWVKDDTVTECYNCKGKFGFFFRRHHCRGCGRVFCYNCSNKWISSEINEKSMLIDKEKFQQYWLSRIGTRILPKYRTCQNCFIVFSKIKKVSLLIQIFESLTLTLLDYHKIMYVCKDWYDAVLLYLSKFREIQYNLPNHIFTEFEKKSLKNNLSLIAKHDKLSVQLIKSVDFGKEDPDFYLRALDERKIVKCWTLMCGRYCSDKYDSEDIIDILLYVRNYKIRRYFISVLTDNAEELLAILPILTYCIRFDQKHEVSKFLIKKSLSDEKIRNYFYWEVIVQLKETQFHSRYQHVIQEFRKEISEKLNIDSLLKLTHTEQFVDLLETLSKNTYDKDIKLKNTFLPLDPSVKIDKILVDKIEIKKSASKPMFVPCLSDDVQFPLIYKKEDVRKDRIILSIITMMDLLLKKEGYDMGIITYGVLPTSMNSGIIEVVQNAETIYRINQKMKYTIQNYIMENNPNLTVDKMKKKFLRSVAGYCVITYLLGIGDRHLDNIMVTCDGKLFHIDYGFVLGLDPKPLAPYMRITPEMVDTIGGINSKYYVEFQMLCTKCYNILRRYHNLFMNMLLLLTRIDNGRFSLEDLEREIIKRFLPGENYSQAEIHLISKIQKSQTGYSWIDFFHSQKKEGTVTQYASYMYESTTSLFGYFTG